MNKKILSGLGDPMECLTVQTVAKLLHMNEAAVRDRLRAGELPSITLGRRRRILRGDLQHFLAANRTANFDPLRQPRRHAETEVSPDPEDDLWNNDNIPFDENGLPRVNR